MTHPFNCNEHPAGHLVNISSGVVATKDIQKSLTSVIEVGTTQMEQYINESLSVDGQKSRFEAIKKTNLKTFTSFKKRTPIQIMGNKTLLSVNPEMVFRRSLSLTQVRPDLTLKDVLSYPITSVPSSLFHDDGALRKNNKSELAHILENLTEQSNIASETKEGVSCNALIRDAMAELHVIGGNGGTFGDLANRYFKKIMYHMNTYDTVIDVFDQYDETNSVKTNERMRHLAAAGGGKAYKVLPGRFVPQWSKFMASSSNKKNLTDFLCKYVSQHAPKEMLETPEKKIYLAGGFFDGTHTACVTSRGTEHDQQLSSTQEEADTRIFLHVKHLDSFFLQGNKMGSIMIQAADTDVLVLAVHIFPQLQSTQHLWIEKKNFSRMYFDCCP